MAVRAVDGLSGNLPAELTTFVGRRHELADLKARLSRSRLVTVTGVGGVGKTRLALRVAWELRRSFRDGVWVVELAALRDPGLIEHTLAASLGLHDRSPSQSIEWLLDQLAEREMLIVLDNCEHLVEASASLANTLLRACKGMRILATSRQPLGIDGEQLSPLMPLSAPSAGEATSAVALLRYEAVALFIERAVTVHPGFAVNEANRIAVASICRRLDGIPLAVELAASRLRFLSVHDLMARLDDCYALLSGGSRTALPRQQTLKALVDWSFELCSDAERLMWARLSTFAGGFDLDAAELVGSGEGVRRDEVWEVIGQLVDKSIVLSSDTQAGVRYYFPETLREYGRDRLRAMGTAPTQERHCEWMRQLTDRFAVSWFGAEQVPMLIRMRREHSNLREALDFCLRSPEGLDKGLEMAGALRFYWLVSGRVNEGRHWLDQFLIASDEERPSRVRATCAAAYLATMASDFASAHQLVDQAESLGARLHDRVGTALAFQVKALTALFQGNPGRAAPLFQKALASHRGIADESAAVYDQVQLALCTALLGDADTATRLLDECLMVTESRGENWLRALTLWALGIEQCKLGDYDKAEASELASLRLRIELDDRSTIGRNLQVLGWIASATGDAERGARLLGASEEVAQSVGVSIAALGHLRDLQESYVSIGRRTISDSKFAIANEEGRLLGFDEAVGLALNENLPSPESVERVPPTSAGGRLTPREVQVAELVSRGMSNKEIAAALVISQRTAEGHVEHILTKLGATSRTQVATWMLRRGD